MHLARRTGRAREFAVYSIENGIVKHTEYLRNDHPPDDRQTPHQHAPDRGHRHSHSELVRQMKGVDAFLVSHLGRHFKEEIETAGIPYHLVKGFVLEEIVQQFCESEQCK
jgi:predicted Fe-Mo cluster-binding NifX family protein